MASRGDMYIVKASTVPVRLLRLRELEEALGRLLEAHGLTMARGLLDATMELAGESSDTWVTAVPATAMATLWRYYILGIMRSILKTYARTVLGNTARLEELYRRAAEGSSEAVEWLRYYMAGLADLIAYMLRYPLYRSPLAAATETVVPGVQEALLLAHLGCVHRVLLGHAEGCSPDTVYDALDALQGMEPGSHEAVLREVLQPALSEDAALLLELFLYTLPADTRPGLNATSLLVHLLSVSAGAAAHVAAALGERSRGFLDVEVVRLAGLLHDIGKPVDPARHVEASVAVARELLKDLVPGGVLEAVIELIRSHHSREVAPSGQAGCLCRLSLQELHRALRCADGVMAGMDRLVSVVREVYGGGAGGYEGTREALLELGERLGDRMGVGPLEALEGLYSGRSPEAARAYRELLSSPDGVSIVARASRELVKLLFTHAARCGETRSGAGRQGGCGLNAALAVVDIGGVQAGLAESYRLRSLSGFSLLVDFVTLAAVPYALTLAGAPLEAVIYSGGGTVHAIVPYPGGANAEAVVSSLEEAVRRVIESRSLYALALHGVKIRVGVARLGASYGEAVREAYRGLGSRTTGRPGPAGWLASLFSGLAAVCDSCGVRPAGVSYGDEAYCPVCAARYEASEALGYRAGGENGDALGLRMRVLKEALGKEEYRRLVDRYSTHAGFEVMEVIAGGGNYAVLKSDGNTIGAFMASSATATMYFEKSIRIDMATKRALARLFETARRGAEKSPAWHRLLASLILGFMYAGGDDLLLLLPARIALPAAVLLAYEFAADLGFRATLSIGIAAAPPMHNVWWALQAADTLLEEVAKEEARQGSVSAVARAERVSSGGYIAFDYTDGWGLTSSRALHRHKEALGAGMSRQPYPVLDMDSKPGLYSFIARLLSGEDMGAARLPNTIDDDRQLRERMINLLEMFASTGEDSAAERARRLHRRLVRLAPRPALAASPRLLHSRLLLSMAAASATERDHQLKNALKSLLEFSVMMGSNVPVTDVYLVYKYARGD